MLKVTNLSGFGSRSNTTKDIKVAMTRVTPPGSLTTFDATVSGFGTPKAAIVFWTPTATSDGTAAADAQTCFGVTDGTNEWCFAHWSEDNVTGTNVARVAADASSQIAIALDDTTSDSILFNSWITDGVRFSRASGTTWTGLMTVILFGGNDFSADVGVASLTTQDTATSISSLSYEPDLVIAGSHCSTFNETGTAFYNPTLGFAHNGTGITQCSIGARETDGLDPTNSLCIVNSNRIGSQSDDYFVEISNFDANGFDLTPRTAASNDDYGWMAFNFNGAPVYIDVLDTPTSTGNWNITSVGFKPIFGMFLTSMVDVVDVNQGSGGDGGVWGLSAFTDSEAYSMTVAAEDNVSTTNTQTVNDNIAVYVDDHTGTSAFRGTFSTFLSNGVTLNLTDVDATARKWPALFIGV